MPGNKPAPDVHLCSSQQLAFAMGVQYFPKTLALFTL